MPLAPYPDILRVLVPFIIQFCGDTGTNDIENCAQGGSIFAAESHRGQLFCCGEKGNDTEEKGADTYRTHLRKENYNPYRQGLFLMQKEVGTEFSCSTDLFLVWCHPH